MPTELQYSDCSGPSCAIMRAWRTRALQVRGLLSGQGREAADRKYVGLRYVALLVPIVFLFVQTVTRAQTLPNVRCHVENYVAQAQTEWQVPPPSHALQVVVLRDPAGEQEARFDLTHGASLISLRYHGKELLFGHGAGADVSMYKIRHGTERELKGLSPYWSSFHPDQGDSSMGVPATVAGVACHGESTMRAFAMMVDAAVDSSFRRRPLIGVWKGRISNNFPPGYSTPYAIETKASWIPNPGGSPHYYLKLNQLVVNVRTANSGPMQWFLMGTAPWRFDREVTNSPSCSAKTPCASSATRAIAIGRYSDTTHTRGVAIVVPTGAWKTHTFYLTGEVNAYGGAPVVRKRSFGVVLVHSLHGISGFHFTWYVCAGSWEEASSFARGQAR